MAELQSLFSALFSGGDAAAQLDDSALALLLKSLLATIAGVITYILNSEHPFIVSGILITAVLMLRRIITTILIGTAVIIGILILAQLFVVR